MANYIWIIENPNNEYYEWKTCKYQSNPYLSFFFGCIPHAIKVTFRKWQIYNWLNTDGLMGRHERTALELMLTNKAVRRIPLTES